MSHAGPARPARCACGSLAELLDSFVERVSPDGLVTAVLRILECPGCRRVRLQRKITTVAIEDLGDSERLSFSR